MAITRYRDSQGAEHYISDRSGKTGEDIERAIRDNAKRAARAEKRSDSRDNRVYANALRNAIAKPTTNPTPTAPTAPSTTPANNSDTIDFTKLYSNYSGGNYDSLKQSATSATQSLIDSIKQKIAQQRQQYQPLRNQNEVGRETQLQSMREALANQGNAGGTGRQELLNINTSADNTKNSINLQEQNLLDQGELEKQNTIKQAQADLLEKLIAENKYQDEQSWREKQFDFERDRYKDEQDRYEQEYEDERDRYEEEDEEEEERYSDERDDIEREEEEEKRQQMIEEFKETIGQYHDNYQAEIDNIVNDGDSSNDWKLPYLKTARNQKVMDDLERNAKINDANWQNAYKAWLQLTNGATESIAKILGIPKGTKAKDIIKADYDTNKPYYKPSTGSSSGGYELEW